MRSVTVGTSTSAALTASARSACVIGLSSSIEPARRTIPACGFRPAPAACGSRSPGASCGSACLGASLRHSFERLKRRAVQPSLTGLPDTAPSRVIRRLRPHVADDCNKTNHPTDRTRRCLSGHPRGFAGAGGRRSRARQRQRSAGAALCQPEIRPGECAQRTDQGSRRRLGLHPFRPAGRDYRRIRELAPHPRRRRFRGLGLPFAAVRHAAPRS